MTDVIRNAAAKTTQIIEEAELAVRLLEARDFNRGRINALGIIHDPHAYRIALTSARAAIDRALMLHDQTAWPTEQDYHAL